MSEQDPSWGEILVRLFDRETRVIFGCWAAAIVALTEPSWLPEALMVPMWMAPMFGIIWVGWYSKD